MIEPWVLAGALVIVFLGAILQGSIGFGFSILTAPTLALLAPELVPITPQFLALPVALAAALRERRDIDVAGIGWVVAGRVPGTLLAVGVLTIVAERTLDLLIGVLVVLAVALMANGLTVPLTKTSRSLAGVAAGFSSTASAIGGPPLALLYRRSPGPTVRPTMGAIMAIGLVVNLIALGWAGLIDRDQVNAALVLFPASVAGFVVSTRLRHRVDGAALRRLILIVAAVAGTGLILRAVS